jgi:2-polyprenyl-6-methoxyphenol hydroxylase-like FAD-dependent oxidoreductase
MMASVREQEGAAPVIVVGAGPTGLAAALDLARFGVPVRIIDKLAEPQTHSRAIAIQPRTLELFEQRGIAEPILALGHKARYANFYHGEHRFLRLGFDRVQSRYNFITFLDQTKTERVMRDKLAESGTTLEQGVELIDFLDTDDRVELTLRHPGGHEETTWTPYLLGCDGAHSLVRRHLDLQFAGRAFPGSFLLADLHVDWDMPDEEDFYVFTSDEGLLPIFNLGGGISRLVADVPADGATGTPSLEECQAIVDRRMAHRARLSDLRWSSYFHINSRRVERLRVGRVFVAGDASHIHSPAGGQGMNTGIQEAINLAWKLALVMRGEAGESLLDTYDEERRPIEKTIIARTDALFGMVGAQGGLRALLRDWVVPLFGDSERMQRFITDFVSELAIGYRSSSLSLPDRRDGGAQAGDRAADAAIHILSGPDGERRRRHLFELMDPAKFTLLLLDPVRSGEAARNSEAAALLSKALPNELNVWHAVDAEGQYGGDKPSFYLIRPDGYVMLRGTPDDAGKASEFCRQVFARAA